MMAPSGPGRTAAAELPGYDDPPVGPATLVAAYRRRWKRRRLLLRAFRAGRQISAIEDRTGAMPDKSPVVLCVFRNEALRLPQFLDHHRALGAGHFLMVDNGSTDGSAGLVAGQADVSLFRASGGYRAARYGMDWANALLARHGQGRWCLTLDADELFQPHDGGSLPALIARLETEGRESYGALMVELFPRGPLAAARPGPGQSPLDLLGWFDPAGYRARLQLRSAHVWVQGGPRARVFFSDDPDRAPTLSKTPLVRWHWRYAYVSSTHSLLPARLNRWEGTENGLILHTKFLADAADKARDDLVRQQHFNDPAAHRAYYEQLLDGPDLWHDGARRYSLSEARAAGLTRITCGGYPATNAPEMDSRGLSS